MSQARRHTYSAARLLSLPVSSLHGVRRIQHWEQDRYRGISCRCSVASMLLIASSDRTEPSIVATIQATGSSCRMISTLIYLSERSRHHLRVKITFDGNTHPGDKYVSEQVRQRLGSRLRLCIFCILHRAYALSSSISPIQVNRRRFLQHPNRGPFQRVLHCNSWRNGCMHRQSFNPCPFSRKF